MRTGTDIDGEVRTLLRERSPVAASGAHGVLADELRLGTGGLGLDSIAMVELLLDCERRFGIQTADLLEGAPLTVGRLVAHLRAGLR
ncbi:MAG TPA: phosphopantetheine-binding protein [Thermoanaerobaculia bacterium]|nr:phosphopantetheine-binding protein [Thermoanaerobaculia bacterium]